MCKELNIIANIINKKQYFGQSFQIKIKFKKFKLYIYINILQIIN